MSIVRAVAAALVLVLVGVPAASRVTQRLDSGHPSKPEFSFRKSVDTPPDPVNPVTLAVHRTPELAQIVRLVPEVRRPFSIANDPLPNSPELIDSAGLRAPPVTSL